jgi:hypothetical protein
MHEEAALRIGQEVIAGDEAIGELVEILRHEDVVYLHIQRYGPGHDDVYIPSVTVARILPKQVYLDIDAETLVGEAWHVHPIAAR